MRNRLITVVVVLSLATAVIGQACETDRIDSRDRVVAVYDGDTIMLESGKRVRIIGLNAPEMGYNDRPPQAYATSATRSLEDLLSRHHNRVSIRYDAQRYDTYGRTLAHLFVPDGISVSAYLISLGLAKALTIPPNTWNAHCYHRAESDALEQQVGVWSLPEYEVVESNSLSRRAQGYRKVRGKVMRVGVSQHSTWLNLEGLVVLRIDHEDRGNFIDQDLVTLEGARVLASGRLYPRKGRLYMRVRHPMALEVDN